MTDGHRGVLVSDGKTVYRAGVYQEREIVDRTGAGDAFGSGFVAGLMGDTRHATRDTRHAFAKEAIEYAIRLGSANATSVVEYIGGQEGILRRGEFVRHPRWKRFKIVSARV